MNNTLPTATLNFQNNGWRWVPRLLADVAPPLLSTSKQYNLSFKPDPNLARCGMPAGKTVNVETIAWRAPINTHTETQNILCHSKVRYPRAVRPCLGQTAYLLMSWKPYGKS